MFEKNMLKSIRLVFPILGFLGISVAGFSQVYLDDFSQNSLEYYNITGGVSWSALDSTLHLEGGGSCEIYTKRDFGNNFKISGKILTPSDGANQWGSAAIAIYDETNGNKFWGTLAFGYGLNEKNNISIMLNDSWGALYPLAMEDDTWYHVKMTSVFTENERAIKMKAWKDGDAEPESWQLSYNLGFKFSADGGIGFRHYGNGVKADDLVAYYDSMSNFDYRNMFPQPVLSEHPDWIDLYWKAWEIASSKVQYGTETNGFVEEYLDEGFNSNIFQWDTCFMMFFAKYCNGVFPTIVSLDNFYRKQHANGAICREIRESDGSDYWATSSKQFTNPPLFAWIEWLYYRFTNDASRFERVLPVLDKYFQWCKQNRTSSKGMYWWNNLGSGMDNSPRPESSIFGWVDYTAQQAMAACYISKIALHINDSETAENYKAESDSLKSFVNRFCWNETDGYYWDVNSSGSQIKTKTAACFWPMIAGIASQEQAEKLSQHLKNKNEFYRPHLFPTLSADHSNYNPAGEYWCGSVWAPTNFMYIKGLEACGYEDFAKEASINHIENMSQVYKNIEPHTIWENYAPESANQGSQSRGNFVGWSGCGPICLLFENIIGIRVNSPENTVIWRLALTEEHGIKNMEFGQNNKADFLCATRLNESDTCHLTITAQTPFMLKAIWQDQTYQYEIKAGAQEIVVPGNGTAIENHGSNLPNDFKIYKNYPNPFNPITTIKYSIPENTDVKLAVYNLMGQEVAELVDEKKDRGNYTVAWNATDLSSGIYFYHFTTPNYQNIGKMMLVK